MARVERREKESTYGMRQGSPVAFMYVRVSMSTSPSRVQVPPIASKRVFFISMASRTSYRKQRTGPPRANRQPRLPPPFLIASNHRTAPLSKAP